MASMKKCQMGRQNRNLDRAHVLAKVEEQGVGSQDQGGHVQQAGRHGGRNDVVQNMQYPCMF